METKKLQFFLIILILFGFLVYVNSLPNGFVWDDEEQIINNLVIRNWKNLPLIFTSSTFYAGGAGLSGGFYRPLVTLSYLLNYSIWGLNPVGFRLFQITFHLLNLILIFFILRKILFEHGIKYADEISFFTALLFTSHPANVEVVVYLGSIGEILYTFFGLLGIFFFLRGIDNQSNRFLFFSFFFIFLGLLAKESALTILFILFIYLLIFRPKTKLLQKYFFGTFLVIGFYSFLRFFVVRIPLHQHFFSPIAQASFVERLLTIPYSIFSYFKIIFFPKDLATSRHFVITSFYDLKFYGALIFLLTIFSLIFFFIWKYRKKSYIKTYLFFLLWFFGCLFPVLNILPLDMTIAERWLYFPLIGFLAFVCLLIYQLKEKLKIREQKILIGFLILVILALSIRTIIRNTNWKNGLILFSHDIQYSKNSFDLENNYGVELFRVGKIDEAGEHFKKSIELQPKWYFPYNNYGAVLERKGDLNGALTYYKKSIELSDYYLAYENIGNLLLKMKRFDEAEEFLTNSLKKFPHNPMLKLQLALLYLTKEDSQKAISLLLSALEDNPPDTRIKQLLELIEKGVKIEI